MDSQASPGKRRHDFRNVITVIIIGWIARFLFVWFMPWDAWSADIKSWDNVMVFLEQGKNPYVESTILNWPPLWMQLIYLVSKISLALNIPFLQGLRIFLALVESLVVVALFRLIRQVAPQANVLVLLLLGIALNPTTIFLTCQQGNFDVLVALWVLLFVTQLIQYYRSRNELDWLAACLFLGLGILTKTVPLVLCPILAGGWRQVTAKVKWLGAVFVLGPVALGMSVIYVLAPGDVTAKVLEYRSALGWFGISGLLHLGGADNLMPLSKMLFYVLLAAGGMLTAYVFWKRVRMEPRTIILCAAMFLAAIPGIGPGYSPQYLFWFLPLLIASFALYQGLWRWVVTAFGIVAAATCIVEYGVLPSHGMYVYFIIKQHQMHLPLEWAERMDWWASQNGEVVMRLPLFVMFLILLAVGTRRLVHDLHTDPAAASK